MVLGVCGGVTGDPPATSASPTISGRMAAIFDQ
jgi:hypothetical protein